MAKKTIENCTVIKMYGSPGMDSGKCRGFGTTYDDEPCDKCKRCKFCSANEVNDDKNK